MQGIAFFCLVETVSLSPKLVSGYSRGEDDPLASPWLVQLGAKSGQAQTALEKKKSCAFEKVPNVGMYAGIWS